jgi:hypothetical protein
MENQTPDSKQAPHSPKSSQHLWGVAVLTVALCGAGLWWWKSQPHQDLAQQTEIKKSDESSLDSTKPVEAPVASVDPAPASPAQPAAAPVETVAEANPKKSETSPSQVSDKKESVAHQAPPAPKPVVSCTEQTYTAQVPAEMDRDEFAEHRHLIPWKGTGTEKQICVKVQGKPVAYEKTEKGLLLAPISNPKSKVIVRACPKADLCSDPCTVAKDSFMDGLGVTSAQAGAPTKDNTKTAGVEAEMKRELAGDIDLEIFSKWKEDSKQDVCSK